MKASAAIATVWLLVSLGHGQVQQVVWEQKAPYADRLLYNGQRYKTIAIQDRIYVWVSMTHTKDLTLADVVIGNDGKSRFDVDPERFVCTCVSPVQRLLKYSWPFGYEKRTDLAIMRANTVLPGDSLKGLVSFQRITRCNAIRLVIPVNGIEYEFPFTHEGGSADGRMN